MNNAPPDSYYDPADLEGEFAFAFPAAPAADQSMVAAPCLKAGCNDLQDPGNKRGFCWDCYQNWRDKMDSYMEGER